MTTPDDSTEPSADPFAQPSGEISPGASSWAVDAVPVVPRTALQTRGGILLAVGGALAFLASFLTWASVKVGAVHLDIKGTDGGKDGNLTLFFGLIILALAGWRLLKDAVRPWTMILAGLCALIVLIIGVYDQSSLQGDTSSDVVHVSTGIGLYLEELAGLLALSGAVAALRFKRGSN